MADAAKLRRIAYLWKSAHLHAHDAPDLSRTFVRQLLLLADREGIALQKRVLHRICCQCCTVLIPGLNSTATQRKCPRRPAAPTRSSPPRGGWRAGPFQSLWTWARARATSSSTRPRWRRT